MKASKTRIKKQTIGVTNQAVWVVEGLYPGFLGWHRMGEATTYTFARKMAKILKEENCLSATRKKA